jgi:hypothetical protein
MAVADAAVKASPPPPPPPRSLAFVRFVLAPMLGLVLGAARALLYLCLATGWVLSACGVALVVADLAWGEGSATYALVEAFAVAALKFSICVICLFLALAAAVLCLAYVIAAVSGSGPIFKKVSCNRLTP